MNNLIVSKVTDATMSSREIAQLTGKRHDHILGDIRRVLTEAEIDCTRFEGVYLDQQLIERVEFMLPKRECDLVISGYSVKYRLAIIDRWQELEAKQVTALPNYQEALRQLADSIDLAGKQQALIEQQKPAVEFVERYIESSGNKGFREVCKLLKVKENQFREFLIENKIMYRLNGNLTPYGNHLDAGRFEVNAGLSETDHAFTQAKFTPKGISWVAGLWMAERIA